MCILIAAIAASTDHPGHVDRPFRRRRHHVEWLQWLVEARQRVEVFADARLVPRHHPRLDHRIVES